MLYDVCPVAGLDVSNYHLVCYFQKNSGGYTPGTPFVATPLRGLLLAFDTPFAPPGIPSAHLAKSLVKSLLNVRLAQRTRKLYEDKIRENKRFNG